MILIFSWSRSSKTPQDLMHLARKLKMAKPNLSNHNNFIRHYKPNMECSNVNVASMTLMEPVELIDNSTYSTYSLLKVTISKTSVDKILTCY